MTRTTATADRRLRRTEGGPIRVFLVDGEELERTGLRCTIERTDDVEVVGEAATVAEATARLPLADPDVAVIDLELPDGCGTDVCRFVGSHLGHTRRLVIGANGDDAAVAGAVRAGADGYVMKRISGVQFVDTLRRLAAGKPLTDRRHRARIEGLAGEPEADERLGRLTHQERVLLEHLARGLTNREIATAMRLSDKTVKNYVSSLMMKLEVTHRAAAAAYFARVEAQQPCSAQDGAMGNSVIRY